MSDECNICLDDKSDCLSLPCCNGPKYCATCVDKLTSGGDTQAEEEETSDTQPQEEASETTATKYGKCPTCKKVFAKSSDGEVSRATGKCYMCGHGGMILASIEQRDFFWHMMTAQGNNNTSLEGLCDNCWICKAYPELYRFQYECDRCHLFQTIPHPMYRYQAKRDEFGGPTWACHQRCGDYTRWRIKPEDAERVPALDKPATWD